MRSHQGSAFGFDAVVLAAVPEIGGRPVVQHGEVITPGQAALHLPDQVLRPVPLRAATAAVGEPVARALVHPRKPWSYFTVIMPKRFLFVTCICQLLTERGFVPFRFFSLRYVVFIKNVYSSKHINVL